MLVTEVGILIVARAVTDENTESPRNVTVVGMVMVGSALK